MSTLIVHGCNHEVMELDCENKAGMQLRTPHDLISAEHVEYDLGINSYNLDDGE